jgi:hypothetical protein
MATIPPHPAVSSAEANATEKSLSATAPTEEGQSSGRDIGVTRRVIVISLLLAALFGIIVPYNDFKFSNTYLGATHMPPGAILALVFMLAAHALLKCVLPRTVNQRLNFSRNEVLTVYIIGLFAATVPGKAAENFFVPNLIAPFYFATRENGWLDFLTAHLPSWFTPALTSTSTYNRELVEGWYIGGNIPWTFWILPLLAWASLILAVYTLLACLAVMLRAQWAAHEALTFPLLRLPLELTQDIDYKDRPNTQSLLHNPLTWIGMGIAFLIQTANSLNLYFPDVPKIPLSIDASRLFTEAPWNQMGQMPLLVYPVVVGISYLVNREISFSLWFFFLLHKFEYLVAYSLGFMPNAMPDPVWTRGWAKSFISYQQIGAYFAYAALLLWIGREHFRHVLRRAFGHAPSNTAERIEALSYPLAFWGFVSASIFILLWSCAAGVRPTVAVVFWFTYLVMAIGLTRVVVEGGLLCVNAGWMPLSPLAHLIGAGPGAWLGPASGVPLAFMQNVFLIDMKGFLLPSFLHGFKLAHDRGLATRRLLPLVFAVILIALGLGIYTNVQLGYNYGGLQLNGWWATTGPQEPARGATEIMRGVQDNFLANWAWMGVGAGLTWGIVLARAHYSWFILHPIGLLMWSPFVTHVFWVSIFLGWLCKGLIMRYGGADAYRRLTPAFSASPLVIC